MTSSMRAVDRVGEQTADERQREERAELREAEQRDASPALCVGS